MRRTHRWPPVRALSASWTMSSSDLKYIGKCDDSELAARLREAPPSTVSMRGWMELKT